MIRNLFSLIALLIAALHVNAQELNATVRITAPKLQTTDPQVFKTMEQAILDFMNNNKWTQDDWSIGRTH